MRRLFSLILVLLLVSPFSTIVSAIETDTFGPTITIISCDKENETLYEGDSITLKFSIEDPSGVAANKGVLMVYTNPEGGNYTEFAGPVCNYDSETGLYECVFLVDSNHKIGQYRFGKLYAYDKKGNHSYINPNISFFIDNTETDTLGPTITIISCDKENETLYEGDSITLKFSIEDPSGVAANKGVLMVYTNPEGGNYTEFAGPVCNYDPETGLYECVFSVDSNHKIGKYRFGKLYAYDKKGNHSYINPDISFFVSLKDSSCILYLNNKILVSKKRSCVSLAEIVTLPNPYNVKVSSESLYYLGTGTVISIFYADEKIGDYALVVNGDLTGDGVCDVLDVVLVERATSGSGTISNLQINAANGNDSVELDVTAYQNVVNWALSF